MKNRSYPPPLSRKKRRAGSGRSRGEFRAVLYYAGLATLAGMMEAEAREQCGPRYGRGGGKSGHRWGKTKGKVVFPGGKIENERPRVRGRTAASWRCRAGKPPTAKTAGPVALSQMLINVSRASSPVRFPGRRRHPGPQGAGVSKSAASRRFVALSAERMKDWMAADLSKLDLLAIQIDGIHIREDSVLLAAVGVDGEGEKQPLAVMEGETENAAVCQALLDNLTGRGLDPQIYRLFVIDVLKALAKAIRATFGRRTPIQRCQVQKARNIVERLPKPLHASVRETLRQAWELADADKAERLIVTSRGVWSAKLPACRPAFWRASTKSSPSLASACPSKSPISGLHEHHRKHERNDRRGCRNVKCWQDASMALRWTSAAMCEASKGLRKLKADNQLPMLQVALAVMRN